MTAIYARHHYTAEDAELADLRTARQPQSWFDPTPHPTPAQIESDRLEVAALRELLGEIENELRIMSIDDPDWSRWLKLAADTERDLAVTLSRMGDSA